MNKVPAFTAEAAVVGGGPSGLIAAAALASAGVDTVLFAPPAPPDRRTTALLGGSVRVLEALGIWDKLRQHASPLAHLRIVDATNRLIRAPEVLFHADELGMEAFGYNIQNEWMRAGLLSLARGMKNLRVIEAPVKSIEPSENAVRLTAAAAEERVALAIAADGRNSLGRKAAGIATQRREFLQAALAFNVSHTRPHGNVSTEFHTESGPFTLVPLEGMKSSVVCVVTPESAQDLLALDDAALSREIERRAHSMLGGMKLEGGRGSFPLAMEIAERFAKNRIALVGEAGHVLPPIGAQGLNLGIRDAATIAELAADAKRAGRDIGDAGVMNEYHARRSADVNSRAMAVEMMNRSLLTDFLPVQALRGAGFDLVSRIGPLRKRLMREGLGERYAVPLKPRREAPGEGPARR